MIQTRPFLLALTRPDSRRSVSSMMIARSCFLRAARLAETRNTVMKRRPVRDHERDVPDTDGLHAALISRADALLDDLGDLILRDGDAERLDLLFHRAA